LEKVLASFSREYVWLQDGEGHLLLWDDAQKQRLDLPSPLFVEFPEELQRFAHPQLVGRLDLHTFRALQKISGRLEAYAAVQFHQGHLISTDGHRLALVPLQEPKLGLGGALDITAVRALLPRSQAPGNVQLYESDGMLALASPLGSTWKKPLQEGFDPQKVFDLLEKEPLYAQATLSSDPFRESLPRAGLSAWSPFIRLEAKPYKGQNRLQTVLLRSFGSTRRRCLSLEAEVHLVSSKISRMLDAAYLREGLDILKAAEVTLELYHPSLPVVLRAGERKYYLSTARWYKEEGEIP